VAHYRNFSTGAASAGLEAEANALYTGAAYLTAVNNSLAGAVGELRALEARVPTTLLQRLRICRLENSDAQLAVFGTYELIASRYEILCGRQGARGVADPALLESFVDAPATYSSTGREAFRLQQDQAIRNAARVAGRRSRGPGKSGGATTGGGTSGSGDNFGTPGASGNSRKRGRGGRGGGRGARGGAAGGANA
jgi:hypothetical protein